MREVNYKRLIRRRAWLHQSMARACATISAIEDELRKRGFIPPPYHGPVRRQSRFTHYELPPRCLATLRDCGGTLKSRQIAILICEAKGLDPSDPKMLAKKLKQTQQALLGLKKRGSVIHIGPRTSRNGAWALAAERCADPISETDAG
jgi:hypothetical protein